MTDLPIPWIHPGSSPLFPTPSQALREPNGLLAIGGDLGTPRLLAAYAQGIFPWYGEDEPLLWWSPDPRCVFSTGSVHISRSLRRLMRHAPWTITIDRAFREVMLACAAPREGQREGTWIVHEMVQAYCRLQRNGHAHSIEVWQEDVLVGGLYGIAIGRMFCGESMFSARSGGSKVALTATRLLLSRWGFPLLDAQVGNPHLHRMGAIEWSRETYLAQLHALASQVPVDGAFHLPEPLPVASLLHAGT